MSEESTLSAEAALNPKANMQLARGLARALWQPSFKAANPDADAAAIAAAWQAARQEQTAPILRALKVMNNRGFVFVPPATGNSADEE